MKICAGETEKHCTAIDTCAVCLLSVIAKPTKVIFTSGLR